MTEMMHRLNQFRIKTENQGKIKYVRTDRSVIRRITKMAERKGKNIKRGDFSKPMLEKPKKERREEGRKNVKFKTGTYI